MAKKVLVFLGHPDITSFCAALADAYLKGAKSAEVELKVIKLGELDFDPNLAQGYHQIQQLEPDLVHAQEAIQWAEHIVFIYPNWWGSIPALMKGFFDRAFLPGFAFKYRKNSIFWDKLLSGRTAHLIVTMDTPPWYYRWIYGSPGHHLMKRTILGFCGIKVVKTTEFSIVKDSTLQQRECWVEGVKRVASAIN